MKNIIILVAVLLYSSIIFSQADNTTINTKIKYGFDIGTNYSILQPKESLPNNAKNVNGIGFCLGTFLDYSLNDNFIISPKVQLSLYNSGVVFTHQDNSKSTYEVFPLSLNLMTHLGYKLKNRKHTPYLFVGPNLQIPISKRLHSSSSFYTAKNLAIDFGIGLENITKSFIFAPELKYSWGLVNINQNPALQTLYFHNISLILNFK